MSTPMIHQQENISQECATVTPSTANPSPRSSRQLTSSAIDNFYSPHSSRTPSGSVLDNSSPRSSRTLTTGIEYSKEATTKHEVTVSSTPTSTSTEDTIYVDFEENDPRHPLHYPLRKKWILTCIACFASILGSSAASAYNSGFSTMVPELNCTEFQATVGLSVYTLGFAVVPMLTAPLSEEFGRKPLYIWTSIGFEIMFVMVALAPNIQTVIIARFLQGSFASTGATMVGGTIADIWSVSDRGVPMAFFALNAVGSLAIGPLMGGWIEMNGTLGWRWIQWIQMTWAGVYLLVVIFFLDETRASIVLKKIAQRLRKETGDKRYQPRMALDKPPMKTLIWNSCTRPLQLLLTEPIVIAFSLWIGFCWGVLFCMIESVGVIFRGLHNFNVGQVGTVFTTVLIGSFLGFLTNFYQEKLYHKKFPIRGPESRLYAPCLAGFFLPISMFIYAWCSFPSVHWISLCIAMTLYMWAAFTVYVSVFSYLADCYGPYASSVLAGQSLFRNLLGTIFPLFTQQMYRRLGFPWANTLFGCLAILMVPIPFVLFNFGPKIRMMSKFSRQVVEAQQGS